MQCMAIPTTFYGRCLRCAIFNTIAASCGLSILCRKTICGAILHWVSNILSVSWRHIFVKYWQDVLSTLEIFWECAVDTLLTYLQYHSISVCHFQPSWSLGARTCCRDQVRVSRWFSTPGASNNLLRRRQHLTRIQWRRVPAASVWEIGWIYFVIFLLCNK